MSFSGLRHSPDHPPQALSSYKVTDYLPTPTKLARRRRRLPLAMQLSQDIPGLTYKAHAYGQHSLQRVGVWQFASSPAQERSGWWMMYCIPTSKTPP